MTLSIVKPRSNKSNAVFGFLTIRSTFVSDWSSFKSSAAFSTVTIASLIFAGTGYAQAKSVEAKYEEQSKQIELYKNELNDMQGQLQEYTKYKAMYECIAVEKDQLQKEVEELSK